MWRVKGLDLVERETSLNRNWRAEHQTSVLFPRQIVLLLVLSTLAVLLLPLASGPYTATNGPATAFRGAVGCCLILLAVTSVLLSTVLLSSTPLAFCRISTRWRNADCNPLPALRC
jgi:hypothetical protein